MKILLLSCCTGEGHNSAAKAIMQEFEKRGIQSEITDPIAFISEAASKFVSAFYNNMIKKTPQAFGAMYKVSELYSNTELSSPVYWLSAGYARKMLDYIREGGYDAVISTHLFGITALTAVRKKSDVHIPSYGVLTDYTAYPFVGETDVDRYFIPHPDIAADMAEQGIPAQRCTPTGIPVREAFCSLPSRQEAREALGIPTDKRMILVMTGGVGCDNMTALCDEVVTATDERVVTYVLVGKNNRMQKELVQRYGEDGPIRPVPFTTEVHTYMRAADVLMTKAGGLSSTEALVTGVPLVHVKAIPGCETYNVKFFSERGLSLAAKTDGEAAAAAMRLLFDEEGAARMREAQRIAGNPFAARDLVQTVLDDLKP